MRSRRDLRDAVKARAEVIDGGATWRVVPGAVLAPVRGHDVGVKLGVVEVIGLAGVPVGVGAGFSIDPDEVGGVGGAGEGVEGGVVEPGPEAAADAAVDGEIVVDPCIFGGVVDGGEV